MGLLQAGFTFIIGYFCLEFIKKHQDKLKDIPFISDYIFEKDDDGKEINNPQAYLLFMAFVLKDFLF